MITFDFVPLHSVADEIIPEIPRHYSEMTEPDEYGMPDVDFNMFISASHKNLCKAVTIRDDGKLIGYSIFVLGVNPRNKNLITADNVGFFLEKKYRGAISVHFIKKCDEYLESLNIYEANYILSDDRIGRLLTGYKVKYKIWSKTYGK